ncbi:MAG: hypothetical protein HY231_16550 [Acidobacteria bacterium]|nr:hypothetical protein [Acidobacteriota bacterium]
MKKVMSCLLMLNVLGIWCGYAGSTVHAFASNFPKLTPTPAFQQSALPDSPKTFDELKKVLKERYDGKIMIVAVPGLSAGEYKKELFGSGDASLFWHHFHESVPVPKRILSNGLSFIGKKTSDLEQLDDRTFADLNKGLNVSPLEKGEPLKVHKFYVYPNYIEFDLTTTRVGHMRNMDMNKASTQTTTTVSGGTIKQNVSVGMFGLIFRFYFDKEKILKSADAETILAEINKYLLPKSEAEKVLNAERNIQIDLGMSEETILQKMGQPLKTIQVGNQKFLKYTDMTIILKDGKVAEVKVE